MGNNMCSDIKEQDEVGQFNPIVPTFIKIDKLIEIQQQHQQLFQKIKKKFDVIDCTKDNTYQWYQTLKFNLYLYGNIQRDRPIGQCFFYIRDKSISTTPIIIATKINQYYVFSQKTLIIYPDSVLYYGSIKNSLAYLPRAEGKGVLVNKQSIYQGQFKNGYPHGYGYFRSKSIEYVGQFKNGQPAGECIQKSFNQLFIGLIAQNGQRHGLKINKNNKKTIITNDLKQQESRISLRSHLKQQ